MAVIQGFFLLKTIVIKRSLNVGNWKQHFQNCLIKIITNFTKTFWNVFSVTNFYQVSLGEICDPELVELGNKSKKKSPD